MLLPGEEGQQREIKRRMQEVNNLWLVLSSRAFLWKVPPDCCDRTKSFSSTGGEGGGEGLPAGHAPKPSAPQGDERKGKVVGVSLLLAGGKQL